MRRFSQSNHLATLSEINITPLLDLAFVLLIIFIITTPLLENSIALGQPNRGPAQRKLEKSDIHTIEISSAGSYAFDKRKLPLPQIISQLAIDYRSNTNVVVDIHADKDSRYDYTVQLLDACNKNGITRYSIRTAPLSK